MAMFPQLYDLFLALCEGLGLRRLRSRLTASARGRVLEIGAGTGLNLLHYRQAGRIVVTDIDPIMLSQARRRLAGACCPVDCLAADAQALPFAAEVFDEVVVALAFCTIPHPDLAFNEIHRVLKPDGVLRLLEHVRTPRGWASRLQDILTPFWKRLTHGCHLNRSTLETACAHGFTPVTVRRRLDGWLLEAEMRKKSPGILHKPLATRHPYS